MKSTSEENTLNFTVSRIRIFDTRIIFVLFLVFAICCTKENEAPKPEGVKEAITDLAGDKVYLEIPKCAYNIFKSDSMMYRRYSSRQGKPYDIKQNMYEIYISLRDKNGTIHRSDQILADSLRAQFSFDFNCHFESRSDKVFHHLVVSTDYWSTKSNLKANMVEGINRLIEKKEWGLPELKNGSFFLQNSKYLTMDENKFQNFEIVCHYQFEGTDSVYLGGIFEINGFNALNDTVRYWNGAIECMIRY